MKQPVLSLMGDLTKVTADNFELMAVFLIWALLVLLLISLYVNASIIKHVIKTHSIILNAPVLILTIGISVGVIALLVFYTTIPGLTIISKITMVVGDIISVISLIVSFLL